MVERPKHKYKIKEVPKTSIKLFVKRLKKQESGGQKTNEKK